MTNTRACGTCRHLDGRETRRGAYCWETYTWRQPAEVVPDCEHAARADGKPPPGQIQFRGERR